MARCRRPINFGTHKRFSSRQEKSYFFLHKVESHEYPLKLRPARGKSLANPWDYQAYVYDLAKS
ncbi:hypothetical protein FR274_20185 [Vibrio vulnificus]|nr:hypothetical protein [Vibrio vulnificus]EGR0106658.1 hypothetical protein [Vibrio vulnificus]